MDTLEEGEELDFDETAYLMYHSLRPEWPCLSFDIIRDQLGGNRTRSVKERSIRAMEEGKHWEVAATIKE